MKYMIIKLDDREVPIIFDKDLDFESVAPADGDMIAVGICQVGVRMVMPQCIPHGGIGDDPQPEADLYVIVHSKENYLNLPSRGLVDEQLLRDYLLG